MMKTLLLTVVLFFGVWGTVHAQFPAIGMRGSATSVGWDGPNDIMMQTTDGVVYTASHVSLVGGGLKFRQNNEWPNNWGGTTFPSGTGIFDQGGVDIPVVPGVYNVTFNLTTLAYNFTYLYPMMGMRGAATTVGWDGSTDIFMNTTDGITYTANGVTLTTGGLKFRQNNEWPNNWGGTTWPSGVAVFDQGGVDVPAQAGTYNVTFNTATLAYLFTAAPLATENHQKFLVRSYPNPVHNIITFAADGNVIDRIQVTDMLGKVVISKENNTSSIAIDMSTLANGLYHTVIFCGESMRATKVIKY